MHDPKNQDKRLTALMQAMRRALKRDHGIDVPFTALRASYLQAQGESPHAPARERALPLQRRAPAQEQGPAELALTSNGTGAASATRAVRRLYLLPQGPSHGLQALALDPAGTALVPQDWRFSGKRKLLALRCRALDNWQACVAYPDAYFDDRFNLGLAATYSSSYCYWAASGDDPNIAWMDVSIDDGEWHKLLGHTLDHAAGF